MDCRESRELMSGAVDNELRGNEKENFYGHIEICGSCRDEFELERLTKAYIKRKITFVDVPYDLEQAIIGQLSAVHGETGQSGGILARVLNNPMFQPVLAVGIVLVLALILILANTPNVILPGAGEEETTTALSAQDVLSIAESNFEDVLSGKFKPQVTAISTADVASFIEKNAGYSIDLPEVQAADWVGGSVSSQNGHKLAHVVYKMGENYIYLYCFPKRAMVSKAVQLPPKCLDTINKDQWFWTQNEDGDMQAVWNYDDNVCVATANLDKKELLAYLSPVQSEQSGAGEKKP